MQQILLILELLTVFDPSEQTPVSKSERQSQILQACHNIHSCECATSHYQKEIDELDVTVNWSALELTCSHFSDLRNFVQRGLTMTYDGEIGYFSSAEKTKVLPYEIKEKVEEMKEAKMEGKEYIDNDKKAFNIFHVKVNDTESTKVMTDCTSNGNEVQCFDNTKENILRYATRLTLEGYSKTKYIGTNTSPFLQLFPDLRYLRIEQYTPILEIYMVEFLKLQELQIEAIEATTKVHCAFDGTTCLTNPSGLRNLNIMGGLELVGNIKLPQKIGKLYFTKYKGNIVGHIFNDMEFNEVEMISTSNNILTMPDFKGVVINDKFILRIRKEEFDGLLPAVYDFGLQDRLEFYFTGSVITEVPFLNIQKKTLDKNQFVDCSYGNSLLEHRRIDEYNLNSEKIIVLRGYQLTLSEILRLVMEHPNYKSATKIQVFAFNMDIDIDPTLSLFQGKTLQVYYADVGTTKSSISPGLRKVKANPDNNKAKYIDLPIQFISVRNAMKADPIFMRAVATCLIMSIGSYDKASPKKLLQSNEHLANWYKLIKEAKAFSREYYTELEISRTYSTFKYLDDYVLLRENQLLEVTRVPLLSLDILSQNIHILAQAGRDIRDKSRHLDTLSTLKEIQSDIREGLQKTLKSVADSKVSVLKASKAKSETLGDIELRKQTDLLKEINSSQELIDHLKQKFEEFSSEVQAEALNFKNGVKLAIGLAVAEAAAEAVNTILSIFSGGFNPVKALKAAQKALRLKQVLSKLVNIMKTIAKLIRNRKLMETLFKKVKTTYEKMKVSVSGFFTRQKKVLKDWLLNKDTVLGKLEAKDLKRLQRFSDQVKSTLKSLDSTKDMVSNTVNFLKAERTVRMGYDPGNPTESVTIGKAKLATVYDTVKEFQDRMAKEASDQGNKLNAVDVFKWTIAKEHVSGMMDTTLSDDVPEATNYRTALLKLVTTGETRTKASLEKAALEAKFAASRYAWQLYFGEAVSAGIEVEVAELQKLDIDSNKETDEQLRQKAKKKLLAMKLEIKWESLAIKLELIGLNEEFCNAYYYFHLERCPQDIQISPSNDLDEVLTIQNMLLYQSNQKLKNLFPPPQTFTERTISIEKPRHCQCLVNFQDFKLTPNMDKETRDSERDVKHTLVEECLVRDSVILPTQNQDESANDFKTRKHKFTNNLMGKCEKDVIKNVANDNELHFSIDIDSDIFSQYERVRIDEVKAVFKGVKSTNGIIQIYVESTGISEDRYQGKCFKFIGERWSRRLSYYSPDAVKAIKPESSKKLNEDKTIVDIDSGDIHKSFAGVFQTPTVFTTWIFKIPKDKNPGLDLSNLYEIILKFSGSFVAPTEFSSPYKCKVDEEVEDKEAQSQGKSKVNISTSRQKVRIPKKHKH